MGDLVFVRNVSFAGLVGIILALHSHLSGRDGWAGLFLLIGVACILIALLDEEGPFGWDSGQHDEDTQ